MTNQQILKKAIEKAEKNGWDKMEWPFWEITKKYGCVDGIKLTDKKDNMPVYLSIIELLFNHNFAKAFFGKEKNYSIRCKNKKCKKFGIRFIGVNGHWHNTFLQSWQYHLQQMVLEPNPLSYLAKFL